MKYCKLIDVCDFQGGSQPPKSDWITEPKDGYIRMLQIRDFTQNYGKPEYIKITSAIKTCKSDDILIARYGASVGKILTGLSGAYNVAIMKTIPKEKILLKRYLYYFLKSNLFQNYILNVGSRAAQAGFNKEDLAGINIQVHSIETQKNIILQLENIDKLINLRKKAIEKCNNLIKSQFVEMFKNCDKVRLSEIANITMGQSPSSESYNDIGNGLPFFQGKADYGDKYTIVKHWTNQPSKLSYKGDVLMSVRAPVGPVNISSCDCCIGRGLCSISSKDGLTNNEFLFNALNTIQDEIASKGTGSTFKAITKNDVYNIELPLGTLELQNKFAQIVEQIDKQKFVGTKIARLLGKIAILC